MLIVQLWLTLAFNLVYCKEKKKKTGSWEGQFTAELLKNGTSLKDEAGKTISIIFNVSTSTSGRHWT